jgi:hypothetical protein
MALDDLAENQVLQKYLLVAERDFPEFRDRLESQLAVA